ncbi:hypothetical protein [Kocuria rhizophila]|uniref:hypothetical protein n=1 Tax=Kocuria rhizophila TaxID=72000 RepID=UPI00057F10D9|nr:hypothetical protein [Kocuria rhizophila]KIC70153.1 hypothetical protein RK09_02255 [Kocuria rhizophila]
MPESTAPTTSATADHRTGGGLPVLLVVALVLAGVSALCLVAVLVASAAGTVLWPGFTFIPSILFPLAFLLLCVELVRGGARRRSRR